MAARLTDYVAMGWLPSSYPGAFARLRSRIWTLFISMWHGNPLKTFLLQRRVTELALLREAVTRGTVDRGGLYRELELIDEIGALARGRALADGTGLRPYWPWRAARRRNHFQPPLDRTIAPPSAVATPLLKYSVVDPRWAPPS